MTAENLHSALVAALGATLSDAGWDVLVEPVYRRFAAGEGAELTRSSWVRPDLVASREGGPSWVFELKSGPGAAHFGSVAQVAEYVNAVERAIGSDAHGVLITDERPTEQLAKAAQGLDVDVLTFSTRNVEDSVKNVVAQFLESWAPASGSGLETRDDDE